MRSAVEEVFTDSDGSLDELVSSTMRLSQRSFASRFSSSSRISVGSSGRQRW
jgi:hypothetical protein